MKKFMQCLKLSVLLLIICGIIYPLIVTALGQSLFANKANGSFIKVDGKEVASTFIGQDFTSDKFFRGRVSSVNYNTSKEGEEIDPSTVASGSQNLAPSNDELKERREATIKEILKENPNLTRDQIPEDLITSSGSGLDPHISVKGAEVQVDRVSNSTGISKETIYEYIDNATENKQLGLLGQTRVNVVKLNIQIAKSLNLI